MALHFVSTSVLTSDDGIQFSKEVHLETEEAKKIRLEKEKAASKPLYLQLAEQQEKQQEERDKITKLIFAPPKALDDEEFEFINSVQQNESSYYQNIKVKEEEELKRFRETTQQQKAISMVETPLVKAASTNSNNNMTQYNSTSIIPTIKVKKRKTKNDVDSKTSNHDTQKSLKTSNMTTTSISMTSSMGTDTNKIDNNDTQKINDVTVLSSLVDYPSDSDSDKD